MKEGRAGPLSPNEKKLLDLPYSERANAVKDKFRDTYWLHSLPDSDFTKAHMDFEVKCDVGETLELNVNAIVQGGTGQVRWNNMTVLWFTEDQPPKAPKDLSIDGLQTYLRDTVFGYRLVLSPPIVKPGPNHLQFVFRRKDTPAPATPTWAYSWAPSSGDPCEYANDGSCDVPLHCSSGDYTDCGTTSTPTITSSAPTTPAPTLTTEAAARVNLVVQNVTKKFSACEDRKVCLGKEGLAEHWDRCQTDGGVDIAFDDCERHGNCTCPAKDLRESVLLQYKCIHQKDFNSCYPQHEAVCHQWKSCLRKSEAEGMVQSLLDATDAGTANGLPHLKFCQHGKKARLGKTNQVLHRVRAGLKNGASMVNAALKKWSGCSPQNIPP